jgi:thiamine-monophosphate kinase
MSREAELIARIRGILGGTAAAPGVLVGIGDDAAVLDRVDGKIVVTVDEQVEGTHFRRDLCSLEDVGFRATMAAASDLAAMGATPLAAVCAWVLPHGVTEDEVVAVARGQRAALDELAAGATIVGGNLARGPSLALTTTWIGACDRPVRRDGARPGDGLWVAGDLGLAAAGFAALAAGTAGAPPAALEAWRRPRARIADGLRMAGVAHACIDVSDGLATDAGHLAEASGLRAVLDEVALRKYMHSAIIEVARALGRDPLDLALGGGEDYALVCASDVAIDGFTRIGALEAGEGVVLRGAGGDRPARGGFDHFG